MAELINKVGPALTPAARSRTITEKGRAR